jgi:hypothetical protein
MEEMEVPEDNKIMGAMEQDEEDDDDEEEDNNSDKVIND